MDEPTYNSLDEATNSNVGMIKYRQGQLAIAPGHIWSHLVSYVDLVKAPSMCWLKVSVQFRNLHLIVASYDFIYAKIFT